MLSSSKVLFFGRNFGEFSPRGPPNLVKIIVPHTASYIVSFNFLREPFKIDFFGPTFWGSPLS